LVSGGDPLGFDQNSVSAVATLAQTMTPLSTMTTSSSSTNTYSGTVAATQLQGIQCDNTTSPTITLTDNAGADDTITLSNCSIQYATVSATITIPNGNMVTAVPAIIPLTNITGTVTISLGSLGASVYNLTGATIQTCGDVNCDNNSLGDPPPTVTPSLTAWTPTAPVGSTIPLSQNVTFTTTPANLYDAVSFTTAATTTDGGTWLTVSPAANTSSTLTITVNPTGLTEPTYTGTVTLNYGQGLTTSIPVTLTLAGGTATLAALPTALTFNYTLGTTGLNSQTLTILPAGGLSVNAAVTSGNSWLIVSPSSGTTPANFTVSINTNSLTAGTLTGNIQITSGNLSPLNVPVTLNVASSGFSVQTTPLTFNYAIGGTTPSPQSASVNGTSGMSFSASPIVTTPTNGTWLVATPSSGSTIPGSVSVSINTTGLTTPGTFTGTVLVSSAAGGTGSIPVTLNVTAAPTLTVSSSTLSFSYQLGSAAPAAQSVNIGGSAGLAFTATPATSSGGAWLTVTPGSPTTPGSINVSLNTSVLSTAGTFNGTVTIAATGATTQIVNVTLAVTGPPTISASTSTLNFSYQIGTTAPAAQSVNIAGTSGLAFTATPFTSSGGSWLSVTQSSPSAPGSINVSITTPGLTTAGTYFGSITIAAAGATPQTVNVTLVVSSAPAISASPSTLSFVYQIGGTAPAAQTVSVGGSPALAFTATAATSSGGAWLLASAGGTTPGSVSVSVNKSALTTPGTYNGTVTIAASGATSQTVNVSVLVSNTPTIAASPSALNFTYQIGGATPAAQPVNISGGSTLSFLATVTSGSPWLTVTPGSGTTPGSVTVAVNTASLTAATYQGTVTITSAGASNGPLSIPVTLTVGGNTPTITLSASTLNFAATVGGAAPPSQTVNVTATAPSPVTISMSGGTWLSASVSSATTPAVVTVSANPSTLTAGTYNGTVIVTSIGASNTPQMIAVQFVVSAPATITATPASLSFAYILGGANPAAQTINVTSSQPATISTTVAGASWLTVTSSSNTTPATLTATVNPASLPAGTFQAAISITSASASNSPQVLSVTLVVSNKPTLAPSPSSLTFSAPAGGPNPAAQSINLSGSAALGFTIATSPSWLSVSSSSGTTPATLVATANIAGMAQGSYQGSITITSGTATNSPLTIPVTLNLAVPLAATGPTIASIVNAASYDASGFSAGVIVTIFGNLLGPQSGEVFKVNSQGGLDTTLAGATVTVDGVPAIPLYVQNGQINAILPFSLGTSGQANVTVTYNNLTSAQFNIPLTFSDVQIFTANASGSGPGSILNQDYSVNTAANPAAKGSVVFVYGTGAGAVSPSAIAGNVAGDALSFVSLPYAAAVNGENTPVLYAGTAPTLVYGVDQFNVQLPADIPSGAVKIVLKVGDSASQPDVTVFVK